MSQVLQHSNLHARSRSPTSPPQVSRPQLHLYAEASSESKRLRKSEKLASTSLDTEISVGVHMVDAYTTQASIDIDANLAFGQNSKTCRNHTHLIPIYVPYVYAIMKNTKVKTSQ
ncbi:hypothetical protein Taro_002666 [Colocasia esculenta]|uniref:Uncharacterized protein n=1 Tax=Colocasia esculenta TaxID=4460 RepID=A0A843THR0_COLES|nr:hypothetical protein [Colocasia esculenta]